jgi:hypothetical protein
MFDFVVFVEVEMMNYWKNKKKLKMMKTDEGCMKMKMREEDEEK